MRIITLDPSSTEVISYLAGVGSIIGVSEDSDRPNEVINTPKVTRKTTNINNDMPSEEIDRIVREHIKSMRPLHEALWDRIYSLDPDLIVGQNICETCSLPNITTLNMIMWKSRFFKLRVVKMASFGPNTFMEIIDEMKKLARIVNSSEEIVINLEKEFKETKGRIRGIANNYKVVFIEWIKPIHLMGKWVTDILNIMGAKPLVRPGGKGGEFEWGTIRQFNPDYLLISPCSFPVNRTMKEIWKLTTLPGWDDMNAVKNKNVYVLEPIYARPTQNIFEFVKVLEDIFITGDVKKEYGIKL